MLDVLGLILGGGRGKRLFPLTEKRSKPAVPLAGKYRLIDIPISNCIHAGIDKIAILTQFRSVSLHRHITSTYRRDIFTKAGLKFLLLSKHHEVMHGTRAQQMQSVNNWLKFKMLIQSMYLFLQAIIFTRWITESSFSIISKLKQISQLQFNLLKKNLRQVLVYLKEIQLE